MSDLVERLRKCVRILANEWPFEPEEGEAMREAADRIESLEAALRDIAEWGPMTVDDQRWRIARAALTASHSSAQPPAPPQQSE